MLFLTPSTAKPGHWRLGEQELRPGDMIEIWASGEWYTALVEYSSDLREQRLCIDGYKPSQPFIQGTPAQWAKSDIAT